MTSAEPVAAKPGPTRRRIVRALLLVLLTASGLVWLALWGAIHGWFPELQRQAVLTALNDEAVQTDFAFGIDHLGGSLVGGFELEGVAIESRSAKTPSGEPALRMRIDTMRFEVDIRPIYEERLVHIDVLDLEGVDVVWVELPEAAVPTPPAAPEDPAEDEASNAPPWTVAIDDLRYRDGHLHATFAPERGAAPFEAGGNANLRGLVWVSDGRPPVFEDFAADLRLIEARMATVEVGSGQARLAGTRDGLELRVERVQARVEDQGRVYLEGRANARFEDGVVDLDGLIIEDVGLDLSFRQLDLASFGFLADADADATRGEAVALPTTRLNGAAHLTKPDAWQIDLSLDPSELAGVDRVLRQQRGAPPRAALPKGEPRLHLAGTAQLRVDADGANATAPEILAAQLELTFADIDLAEFAFLTERETTDGEPPPLDIPTTRLNGKADVSKPGDWQIDLALETSEVDDLRIDRGRSRVALAPDLSTWRLRDTTITSQSTYLRLDANGTPDGVEAVSAEARGLPLAMLERFAGRTDEDAGEGTNERPAVEGVVNIATTLTAQDDRFAGTVEADGVAAIDSFPTVTFELTAELEEDAAITFHEFELSANEPDLALHHRGTSRWRFDDGVVSTDEVDLEFEQAGRSAGGVRIEGLESNGETHRLRAIFDDFALAIPFDVLARPAPALGRLDGAVAFDSRTGPPQVSGELDVTSLEVEGYVFERLELAAETEGALWQLTSRLSWGDVEPLSLSLALPASGALSDPTALLSDPRTRLDLTLARMNIGHLSHFIPPAWLGDTALGGELVGRFQLEGRERGPEISGDITWSNARFASGRADRVALRAQSEGEQLKLDFDIQRDGQVALTARAEAATSALLEDPRGVLRDPRSQATLTAEDVDLAWLVPRASTRRLGRVEGVEGRATGQVEVHGSAEGPSVDGRLVIDRTQIELALFDAPIGPIGAELRFDTKEVRIERLVIGSSKGDAVVQGRYRWPAPNQPDRVELEARLDDFNLHHFPLFEARVTGELDVVGPLSALDANGDLSFERVYVSLPAPQDPLLREVRILGLDDESDSSGENGTAKKPSAYQTMQAQIAIDVQRGAKVRERGADLEVEGQILLRKRRLSPTVLQGSLITTGGTYTFFGRTFTVREGVANFEERLPPDPDLRIEATRRIGDVTVGVRRVGLWSDPAAELFSEPAMGETDILSYLMFGKPRSELGAGDDAQLNSATAQIASNLALAEIARALKTELPVNEISMEVDENMEVSSVGVETNVGEDIILRYDRALQDGVGDRFTVEWRFWRNLSLRSEYTDGGTSGLDLFWSYEY